MQLSKETQAHILLLSANLFYGINFSVAKIPMPYYIQPFGLVLLRAVTATIFFWILGVTIKNTNFKKIEKSDYPKLILSALFGVSINQLLFFKGLDFTTPISASIIMTTTPIAVLIVAIFLIKEKLTWRKSIGLLMGLTGALALILTGSHNSSINAPKPGLGNLFIFINAISYAIYLVTSQKLIKKYDSIQFMKYVFLFGSIMIVPFGFQEVIDAKWQEMTTEVYISIAFILIFVSCLTYYFNTIGLKILPPSTVGIYIYSQPLFAVMIALFMGSDSLDWIKIISAILIFTGVYLVSKRKH